MFSIPSDPVCVNKHVRGPEALQAALCASKHSAHRTGLPYKGLPSAAGLPQPADNLPTALHMPFVNLQHTSGDSLSPTRV